MCTLKEQWHHVSYHIKGIQSMFFHLMGKEIFKNHHPIKILSQIPLDIRRQDTHTSWYAFGWFGSKNLDWTTSMIGANAGLILKHGSGCQGNRMLIYAGEWQRQPGPAQVKVLLKAQAHIQKPVPHTYAHRKTCAEGGNPDTLPLFSHLPCIAPLNRNVKWSGSMLCPLKERAWERTEVRKSRPGSSVWFFQAQVASAVPTLLLPLAIPLHKSGSVGNTLNLSYSFWFV